ncbi:elongation factor Ts [Candidatus Roizmanbacteria bacterium]|nr:elongation factor Ts [Candidatus Roizmanbacteria bacterium]
MYDIKKLKQLRDETGVSIALCKKALEESNNDLTRAKKLLFSWGAEKIKDKTTKTTSQGALFSYVHHNKKIASLVELFCETDFVAKNSYFQHLGQEIAMQVASTPAKNQDELLKQPYNRDASKMIKDLINEGVLKLGENIKIGKFIRLELGVE